MDRLSINNRIIRLIIGALIIAPSLALICASNLRLSPPPVVNSNTQFYQQFLFADFDGDRSFDEAEFSATGQYKDIEIYVDGLREESITFDSGRPEPGKLVSGDIDHDDDQDLIWYSQSDSQTIFFCLNNGRGIFGPAIRYQPSDHQPGLNLNPLLDRESESRCRGQHSGGGTVCALRVDDSSVMNATAGLMTTPVSLGMQREPHTVRSFHLKSVFKRGPPADFFDRRSHSIV